MIEAPVNQADILPTLHGLAGLEFDGITHGRDLSPLFWGQPVDMVDSAFIQGVPTRRNDDTASLAFHLKYRHVRTREWSYVESLDGVPKLLFDMVNDPFQRTNLTSNPAYDTVREELSVAIADWRALVEEPIEYELSGDTGDTG